MPPSTSFPHDFQLAQLETINLQRLYEKDTLERRRLLRATKEQGFFLLDFKNIESWLVFSNIIDGIYELERQVFDLPQVENDTYDVDEQGPMKLSGYKPAGRNIGGVAGNRDGFESWAIPKDGILELGGVSFHTPPVVRSQKSLLKKFIEYMESITSLIYEALSDMLGLDSSDRLESFHRTAHQSPCILRLLKYQSQPPAERGAVQTPHTDLGSLTLLFTKQAGLQILPNTSDTDGWRFVEPKSGCAIVNVGDMLTMLTNGELKSCLHRVGPLPARAMPTRYSFAYLQRPEEHTLLSLPGSSDRFTSGEWLQKKFGMLRKTRMCMINSRYSPGARRCSLFDRLALCKDKGK